MAGQEKESKERKKVLSLLQVFRSKSFFKYMFIFCQHYGNFRLGLFNNSCSEGANNVELVVIDVLPGGWVAEVGVIDELTTALSPANGLSL